MDKEKKNMIQAVILLIILILVIIFAVKVFTRGGEDSGKNKKQSIENSGIDFNSEAYEGKKVYEKDGDIIIEDADGSKTIQTTKTKEDTGLKETTTETKKQYEIKDVKVSPRGGSTIITGNVKNNDNSDHNVIVNIKFYSDDNKIKGATSTKVYVGKGQTKSFSMSIMDDMTNYKYEIMVEYQD